MAFYFYKGFRIVPKDGNFMVLAPSIGNKLVHVSKNQIECKLWIEKADSRLQLLREAKKLEQILK